MNSVAAGSFAGLALLATVCWAIFWMITGWRAMRAHERIAEGLENVARKLKNQND